MSVPTPRHAPSNAACDAPQNGANWPIVMMAVAAGVAAAMHVGKASVALPLLRETFGIGVAQLSLYLSVLSISAALFGSVLGLFTLRIGPRLAGCMGLACLGLGALISAVAPSWPILIAGRLVEAAGLPFVVSAMPAILQAHSSGRARVLAMGFWSTWLPLGVATSMLIALFWIDLIGWRGLFVTSAAFSLLAAAVLFWMLARVSNPGPPVLVKKPSLAQLNRTTMLVALLFLLFSAVYLIAQGFLPSVAVDTLGMSIEQSTLLGGIAALLVIPGNLIASVLFSRGVSVVFLLAISFAAMGVFGAIFFYDGLPAFFRVVAGFLFMASAGGPPGVIWSLIPTLSAQSGASPALLSGVVYQFAGIGQLGGPIAAGLVVQATSNWSGAILVISLAVLLALAVLFIGRRSLRTLG